MVIGFCVERHDTIKTFQPEPFWLIQVSVQATEFRKLVLEWERVRLFDREVASTFHQKIKDCKQAKYNFSNRTVFRSREKYYCYFFSRVTGISQKEKVKQRPQALNTVELMRVASSGLGIYF